MKRNDSLLSKLYYQALPKAKEGGNYFNKYKVPVNNTPEKRIDPILSFFNGGFLMPAREGGNINFPSEMGYRAPRMNNGGKSSDKNYKFNKSKIEGVGTFAKNIIKPGEYVGKVHTINKLGEDYDFTSLGNNHNHSENPNVQNVLIGNERHLFAIKPISKGQELTSDYRLQPDLEQPEGFEKKNNKKKNGGWLSQYADEATQFGQYKKGGEMRLNIPVIDDAGNFDQDGIWVPDWETMTAQAKKLGSKKVKTRSGNLINFNSNWEVIDVDDNPSIMKIGGQKCPKGYINIDGKCIKLDSQEYIDMLDKGQVGTMEGDTFWGNKSTLRPVTIHGSKDKGTNEFYKKLAQVHSPEAYEALLELGQKYGSPYVSINDKPGFFDPEYPEGSPNAGKYRPNFNPFTGNMTLGDSPGNLDDAYIAELAHRKQWLDKGPTDFQLRGIKLYPRIIKNFLDPNKKGYQEEYDIPGSIEYEAHKEIEPKLQKEYDDLYWKKMDESHYYKYPGTFSDWKPTKTYKNGGGLLSRTVTCSNCGWSWKAVDGGIDPMTCHKCGGMVKMQGGGLTTQTTIPPATQDSVRHQANKILQYEQLRGGPGGTPLPQYSNSKYMDMLMGKIYPEVKKIMPNASAMEAGEAMDFVFNAGFDQGSNKITKDPRAFALQEYYRQNDPSKLDADGKWAGRKNAPYSFDQEYNNTIGKLPENQRRILMNKGRDWYYQNTAPKGSTWDLKTQGAHPDYKNTWYGRIWNTNDYKPFDPNNPNFIFKKEMGGDISIPNLQEGNWLKAYGPGGQTTDGCPPNFYKNAQGKCVPEYNPNFREQPLANSNSYIQQQQLQKINNTKRVEDNYLKNKILNQPQLRQARKLSEPEQRQEDERRYELNKQYAKQTGNKFNYKTGDVASKNDKTANRGDWGNVHTPELIQSFAGLTPSGSEELGNIGASTFVNMNPITGPAASAGRLTQAALGQNPYGFDNSGISWNNALAGLGVLGDATFAYAGLKPAKPYKINPTKLKQNPVIRKAKNTSNLVMTDEEMAQAMREIEDANINPKDLELNKTPSEQELIERARLKSLFNKIDNPNAPEITPEQYKKSLKDRGLKAQAGDILRREGQPDPRTGGWSPTNNPETNRMVGLAQYGKPQKLTNLDFVSGESLMNEKIYNTEYYKRLKNYMSLGFDAQTAAKKATQKTLDILKNNTDYDFQLGLERNLQRLTRGSNTYNPFSKDFRPEFLKSQNPLGSQAKSVMRANPSGIMDANFSIDDPNIKVFGDRMPGFNNQNNINLSSIKYHEDLLKIAKDPAVILKIKEKLGKLYQKIPNNIPEGTPYTGTKAFNTITPNKFGGITSTFFATGGITGDPNKPYDAKTNPDGYWYAFGKKFYGGRKSAAQQAEEKKQVQAIKKYAATIPQTTVQNTINPNIKFNFPIANDSNSDLARKNELLGKFTTQNINQTQATIADFKKDNPWAANLNDNEVLNRLQMTQSAFQNQGTIKKAGPEEGILSRAWNIASNPMTALSYAIKGQDIPDNFQRGEKNILDHAVNIINPATYINSGASIGNALLHPWETTKTLSKAGVNLLTNFTDNTNVFNDESNSKALELVGDVGNMFMLGETGAFKPLQKVYNEVATGNSFIPIAWKSQAVGLSQEASQKMFNSLVNSGKLTDAERALIVEYQHNSRPFTGRDVSVNLEKQQALNNIINKYNLNVGENTILTRRFNPDNNSLGATFENGRLNFGDRPTSFSAGVGIEGYGSGANNRLVIPNKYAKRMGNNLLANQYTKLSEEALSLLPEEARGFSSWLGKASPSVSAEREVIGTGLDFSRIGKVKNDIGGYDWIVKPKIDNNFGLIPKLKSYGKDLIETSKAAGRLKLPTYQNSYRWQADQVPEWLMQDAANLTAEQRALTGSWYTKDPNQLGFYMRTRPGSGNVNTVRLSNNQIGNLEANMSGAAKGMSGKPGSVATSDTYQSGELILPENLRSNAKSIKFDVNPTEYVNPYQGSIKGSLYDKAFLENQATEIVKPILDAQQQSILRIPRKYFPFKEGGVTSPQTCYDPKTGKVVPCKPGAHKTWIFTENPAITAPEDELPRGLTRVNVIKNNEFTKEAEDLKNYLIKNQPGEDIEIYPTYKSDKNDRVTTTNRGKTLNEILRGSDAKTRLAFMAHHGSNLFGSPAGNLGKKLQATTYDNCYLGSCWSGDIAASDEFKGLSNFNFRPGYGDIYNSPDNKEGLPWFGVNPNKNSQTGEAGVNNAFFNTTYDIDALNNLYKQERSVDDKIDDLYRKNKNSEIYLNDKRNPFYKDYESLSAQLHNLRSKVESAQKIFVGNPKKGREYDILNPTNGPHIGTGTRWNTLFLSDNEFDDTPMNNTQNRFRYKEGGSLPKAQNGFGCTGKSKCITGSDQKKKDGISGGYIGGMDNIVPLSNAPINYDELTKYVDDQYTDRSSKKQRQAEYAQAAQIYPGLTKNDFYASQAEASRLNSRINDIPTWDKPENQTYDRAWYPYYRSIIQPGVKVNTSQILKFISEQPGGLGGYRQTVESNYGLKKNRYGGWLEKYQGGGEEPLTKSSADWYKQWYEQRQALPQFNRVAGERLKLLSTLPKVQLTPLEELYKRHSVAEYTKTPGNDASQDIISLADPATVQAFAKKIGKSVDVNIGTDPSVVGHEIGHWLGTRAKQSIFKPRGISKSEPYQRYPYIKPSSFKKSGLSSEDYKWISSEDASEFGPGIKPEPDAVLNELRKIEGLKGDQLSTPEQWQKYIDKYMNLPESELDGTTPKGSQNKRIQIYFNYMGKDAKKLSKKDNESVAIQKEDVPIAKHGGWVNKYKGGDVSIYGRRNYSADTPTFFATGGATEDDCPPGWIKGPNGDCVQDFEARRKLAKKSVEIARQHIADDNYFDVPENLKKAAEAQNENAYGCIGGVCSIYTEAGVMSKPNWSNTDFALHAKEYGFPNQGYGLDQLRYLEPGDALQYYDRGSKNWDKAYPHHSQIFLGVNPDSGEYEFFDNFNKSMRSYPKKTLEKLFKSDNEKNRKEYGRIYKVNPYVAGPVVTNPEAIKALEERKKTIEFEKEFGEEYEYGIRKDSPYYKDQPIGMKKFIEWANKKENINNLVEKLGVDKGVINDELLNTFGELGQENKWQNRTFAGEVLGLEGVYEKVFKPKNKSIGPGQIKFNTISNDLKEKFEINTPKDLYNWDKIIPLMTAMNIKNRKWMENKGTDLSKYLIGKEGVGADELKYGVGRWTPYMYRGSIDTPEDIVMRNAKKDYELQGAYTNSEVGLNPTESLESYLNSYKSSPYYKKDLRKNSKLFQEGSYADKVFRNIDENLERSITNQTQPQIGQPRLMQPVVIKGTQKKKQAYGGSINNNWLNKYKS